MYIEEFDQLHLDQIETTTKPLIEKNHKFVIDKPNDIKNHNDQTN